MTRNIAFRTSELTYKGDHVWRMPDGTELDFDQPEVLQSLRDSVATNFLKDPADACERSYLAESGHCYLTVEYPTDLKTMEPDTSVTKVTVYPRPGAKALGEFVLKREPDEDPKLYKRRVSLECEEIRKQVNSELRSAVQERLEKHKLSLEYVAWVEVYGQLTI